MNNGSANYDMDIEDEVDFRKRILAMPLPVRRRLNALRCLQREHDAIFRDYCREITALQKKYHARYEPLFAKRREIVNGAVDVDDCASAAAAADSVDGAPAIPSSSINYVTLVAETDCAELKNAVTALTTNPAAVEAAVAAATAPGSKPMPDGPGIPGFWRDCILNNSYLGNLVAPKDMDALLALEDIRLRFLGSDAAAAAAAAASAADNEKCKEMVKLTDAKAQHGFVLEFHFAKNAFFSNRVLTKTYVLAESARADDDELYVLERTIGCKIDWLPGADLTVRMETRRQRHKTRHTMREIRVPVPDPSFFDFFRPPVVDASLPPDHVADIQELLEDDYLLGEVLRDRVIPYALDWFTGEAFLSEDDEEHSHDGDDDDDDDEDDDDDDDDDDGDDDLEDEDGDDDDEDEDDE